MAPSRAHGFPPFTVVTGQIPVLFSDAQTSVVELPEAPTAAEEASYVAAVCERVEVLRKSAQVRLDGQERRLQQQQR